MNMEEEESLREYDFVTAWAEYFISIYKKKKKKSLAFTKRSNRAE